MKKLVLIYITVTGLLISACGNSAAPAAPTLAGEDIQSTAVAAAFTIVAETHAALPTDTLVPPTETPSPTPLPTDTPLPSPTIDLQAASPTIVSTFTSIPATPASSSSGDVCNQPLTSWQGPSVNITVYNETKPKGDIILSLYIVSDLGECGYLYVSGDSASGPVGQYSAGAFVTGKKSFKVFGGFRLTEASWKIVVKNDSIVALGSCYPNC